VKEIIENLGIKEKSKKMKRNIYGGKKKRL
jgi:hypothetical protein